jgi:hypothetical protein
MGDAAAPALRLVAAALRTRYGLARPTGPLRLVGAVTDPFIYAGIVYLVLAGVFGRTGVDRYFFLAIGFASFRWTLGCVLDGAKLPEIRARLGESARHPTAGALAAVAVPPTAVMMLSLAAAIALSQVLPGAGGRFHALGWLPLVLAVHGVWNLVAVLAIDRLKRGGLIVSERPVMIIAALLWLLSPTLYKFSDIPEAASLVFTTLNPVSHVLAAYYNATWYGVPVSLQVLPAAGLVGLALLGALASGSRSPRSAAGDPPGNPMLIVADPAQPPLVHGLWPDAPVFRPWSGRVQGLSGRDMVELALSVAGVAVGPAVDRIRIESQIGRLFDDQLSIYPAWALSQIAYARALVSPAEALVLDGVLDGADPLFVAQAWARIAAEAAAGRRIAVVTYHLQLPPSAIAGSFLAVRGGRVLRAGGFGPELEALYDEVMDLGRLPDDGDGG